MTSEQFAYWLQGFVELNGSEPTPEQWQSIKDHLKTVFVKVTPEVRPIGPVYPGLRDLNIGWPQGLEPKITCSVYPAENGWPLSESTLDSGILETLRSRRPGPRYN